jgi:hypothetical protein
MARRRWRRSEGERRRRWWRRGTDARCEIRGAEAGVTPGRGHDGLRTAEPCTTLMRPSSIVVLYCDGNANLSAITLLVAAGCKCCGFLVGGEDTFSELDQGTSSCIELDRWAQSRVALADGEPPSVQCSISRWGVTVGGHHSTTTGFRWLITIHTHTLIC